MIATARAVRRIEARVKSAEAELVALRPRLERMGDVIDNVAEWTEGAATYIPRIAADIEETMDHVRGAARLGAMVLLKPLRPLGAALALWKGVRRGLTELREPRASLR
jgi:hypothetical protein